MPPSQALAEFRSALWPEGSQTEHLRELGAYFTGTAAEPKEILVAEDSTGALLGFCELSIRPCAEGCTTQRVAYLEGWYVSPRSHRLGHGRALVEAAEAWARAKGCAEIASDTAAENLRSAKAHVAVGFTEVGLVRCFRKELR